MNTRDRQTPAPGPNLRKSRHAGWLLACLVATCPGIQQNANAESIELGARESANLGIRLIQPQRTNLQTTMDAMATVVVPPDADLAVGAFHSGVVSRLYVGTGDRVLQGQPLAALSSPEFLTQQSNYLDALGMQTLAEATRVRDESLHEEGIISQRRLSETRTRAAEAALHLAEQRQLLMLSGFTAAQIERLELTRKLFETLVVHSPGTGEVLQRWIGAGDRVSPGMPLFRVADLNQLWLEIQLPIESLTTIAPGFLVTRKIPGAEQALAEVTIATRVVDPDSQKAMVRAETITADHHLLPGQRIEVTVHIPAPGNRQSSAMTAGNWEIPARAITRHGARAYVFIKSATGFDLLPVIVTGGNGENAYIDADITSASEIALTGIAALKAIWLSTEGSE